MAKNPPSERIRLFQFVEFDRMKQLGSALRVDDFQLEARFGIVPLDTDAPVIGVVIGRGKGAMSIVGGRTPRVGLV